MVNWKRYFKSKLYIASFFLALIGWFIIFLILFGSMFESQLNNLEQTIQTKTFIWTLRIIVFAMVITLMRKYEWIKKKFEKHKNYKYIVAFVYAVGLLGWILLGLSFI